MGLEFIFFEFRLEFGVSDLIVNFGGEVIICFLKNSSYIFI